MENNFLDDLQRQYDLNLAEVEPESIDGDTNHDRCCDLLVDKKPPKFNQRVYEIAWKDGRTGEIHKNIRMALGREGETLVRKLNSSDPWEPYCNWCHGEFGDDYKHVLVFNNHAPQDPKTSEKSKEQHNG